MNIYKIVEADTLQNLQGGVQTLVAKGFEPVGGILVGTGEKYVQSLFFKDVDGKDVVGEAEDDEIPEIIKKRMVTKKTTV